MLNTEKKAASVLLVGVLLLSSFMVVATPAANDSGVINEIVGPFPDGSVDARDEVNLDIIEESEYHGKAQLRCMSLQMT